MSNIGFATLSVIPSFQGFQSKLTAGTASPMAAAGKNGGKKFGDAAGREAGESFRGRFSGALKGFAPLAGLAAGAGGIAFLKSAIDGASDLSESGNKINAVFGEAQGQVQGFASTAADALGQTRLQALDAASTFGTFGKAAGLTGDALAGFSTELVSLATDMASFYNTDVDTAIQAIGSGLRGEAEPLRQFGVLLDDATLRAEALKQGLISSTKEALTPQQKVLASHAVIMRQTSDAQGDFARTSDGLANMQRTLTAQWEEMKTAVGEELLPAMTSFVGFLSDDALPALSEAGGLAKDAASAFNDLPAPIKAATAAFVALRVASATGLTTAAASGAASLGSSMVSLRLRTMMAADAFRIARAGTLEFSGNSGRFVAPVGRMSAAMTGLGAAAVGAGSSLRRGLSGAMGLIGGPWGAALIGGTAVLTAFYAEHQEAKQRVDDLKASLDEQTGAITDNSREWAAKELLDSGALDAGRKIGLNLETVTDAALGNLDAMQRVNDAIREYALESGSTDQSTVALRGGIYGVRDAVEAGTTQWQLLSEATGEAGDAANGAAGALGRSATATDTAADAASNYAGRLKEARDRLQELIDKEQERADSAVQSKRDQIALTESLEAAREEAGKGARTLDGNTDAAKANWDALLDLADQWNNSTAKVRNARGAYKDMRQNFIDIATSMGATDKKAERLANRFLTMPKARLNTDSIDAAKEKIRELTWMLDHLEQGRKINLGVPLTAGAPTARLNGGPVSAGTPYLVGERRPEVFVPDRPGRIEPRVTGGVTVNVGTVQAHDYDDFMRQMQRRTVGVNGGGVAY